MPQCGVTFTICRGWLHVFLAVTVQASDSTIEMTPMGHHPHSPLNSGTSPMSLDDPAGETDLLSPSGTAPRRPSATVALPTVKKHGTVKCTWEAPKQLLIGEPGDR